VNATSPPAVPAPAARPLSAELAQLQSVFADRSTTLREIVGALASRAFELLMMLLVLPFLLPMSVPGMSTPFGLAVAVIAAQLAFGRLPWLPWRLLDWPLPPGFLARVIAVTGGVVRVLERLLRARWPLVTGRAWLNGLHLLAVCLAALLLALPMPVPFTNTLPGWTVLLLAGGLMERDGLFIVAGYATMLATLVLFSLLGAAASGTLSAMWHWLAG